MEERRRFIRYSTQRQAQYFLNERKREGQECTIINVSRKGLGIRFDTHEEINVGSTIHLEIAVLASFGSINVKGLLKWIEKKGDILYGGIELSEILSDVKFSKLG